MRRLWIALTVGAFHTLAAQTATPGPIAGRVIESSGTTPVPGAIVLLLDRRDSTLSRTLSDAGGQFRLPSVATGANLRVMRIGFAPTTQPWSPAATAPVEVTLRRLPAVLPAVSVIEQPRCPADSNGGLAFALWEQARTALLATIIAQESNPAQLRMIAYDRTFSPDHRELRSQSLRDTTYRSTRGVISQRDAAEYAKLGYRDADAATGVERYYAPDAQVLLDPAFAAAHCLSFRGASATDGDDVGLDFVPNGVVRNRVDVSGTIWIRRTAPALRAIDFRFTNTISARDGSDTLAGGSMRYQEMPNGLTLPVAWNVHAPIRIRDRVRLGNRTLSLATNQVTGIRESGGVMDSARWDDGTTWSANLPRVHGIVTAVDGRPVSSAMVSVRGVTAQVPVNRSGIFILPPLVDGQYAVDVIDTAYTPFGLTRATARPLRISGPAAPTLTITLRSPRALVDSLCADEREDSGFVGSRTLLLGAIRLPDGSPAASATIHALWAADSGGRATMFLEGEADATGRFHVCGIPVETTLSLSATSGTSVTPETQVTASASDPIAAVVMTLTSANDPRVAGYRRRVMHVSDATTRAPIGEAEVTDMGDRTIGRTSLGGDFPLASLPLGGALLRVRKPGYAPRLLIVSISPADSGTVGVALQRVATLDAVRVTAAAGGRKALASGFETRVAQHTGRFITASELRRFDGESLEHAIRSLGLRERHDDYGIVLLGGRGAKPCPVTIFVDGVLFYSNTWRGIPPPDASAMLASEYSGVEYYADSDLAPAGFSATGAGCGTLILWTRD